MLAFMGFLNKTFIANFSPSRVMDDHVFCVDDIFKTTEPFAIKLGMVVHHHSDDIFTTAQPFAIKLGMALHHHSECH